MNTNRVFTKGWSNQASYRLYSRGWPNDPQTRQAYENGKQCGGCSFYATFNQDYGLCCNRKSRHHLETVFEHFTCPAFVHEGWGPHSFSDRQELHCECAGAANIPTADKPAKCLRTRRSFDHQLQRPGRARTAKEQQAVDRLHSEAEQRLIEELKREWKKQDQEVTREMLQRKGFSERYVQRFLAAEI